MHTHEKKFSEAVKENINSTVPLRSKIQFVHFSLMVHTVALYLTGYYI